MIAAYTDMGSVVVTMPTYFNGTSVPGSDLKPFTVPLLQGGNVVVFVADSFKDMSAILTAIHLSSTCTDTRSLFDSVIKPTLATLDAVGIIVANGDVYSFNKDGLTLVTGTYTFVGLGSPVASSVVHELTNVAPNEYVGMDVFNAAIEVTTALSSASPDVNYATYDVDVKTGTYITVDV